MQKVKNGKIEQAETACVICFEEFGIGKIGKVLECNQKGKNYYHEKCLVEWLKQKNECPMCRGDVVADH